MSKKISILLISNTGAKVRQITTSKGTLGVLAFTLCLAVAFMGIVALDYVNTKKVSWQARALKRQLQQKTDEVLEHQKQIELFADQINTLKAEMVALNEFEHKIRIVANLEDKNNPEGLFGIGGAFPEDLDAQKMIKNDHQGLMREMHNQIDGLELATQNQIVDLETLLEQLEVKRNILASTPAIKPTKGWLSCNFGHRKSPFTGKREFHKGIDIATRPGSPILATADGTVSFSGKKGHMGNMIVLDHGHGILTRYGHCKKLLKKRGETVKRGETIALVGNTGRSTGSHVHYEVDLNGLPADAVAVELFCIRPDQQEHMVVPMELQDEQAGPAVYRCAFEATGRGALSMNARVKPASPVVEDLHPEWVRWAQP